MLKSVEASGYNIVTSIRYIMVIIGYSDIELRIIGVVMTYVFI